MGKTKNNSSHKPSKWAALVTYVIALVCLLLGFLVPLGEAEVITDNMLVMQLMDALSKATLGVLPIPAWGATLSSGYSIKVNYFGMFEYNVGALLVVLYAVVTVAALIGLIPVIASKKKSGTALKTASLIECIAIIPLLSLVLMQTYLGQFAYALLIAFGGTLLTLIVQAFVYKKGSGLIKFILFLLSAIATLFCVFNVAQYIPVLKDLELLGGLTSGLYGGEVEGAAGIAALLTGDFAAILGNGEVTVMIINIATLAASVLILLNLLLDVFGLGKKTRKFMLISNLVRYSLEVVAVLLIFIMTFFTEGATQLGLLMIALLAIAILQLVINIIRLVAFGKHRKKDKKPVKKDELTEDETAEGEEDKKESGKKLSKKEQKRLAKEEIKAVKEKEAEEKKAAKEQAAEEKKAAKEQKNAPAVEEHAQAGYLVYNGPTDTFINKLTNAEKTEFFNVFLERNVVSIPNIPQYVPGGKNEKFFSAVFIYFGKIRDYVSDGLLNKLYEQINIM